MGVCCLRFGGLAGFGGFFKTRQIRILKFGGLAGLAGFAGFEAKKWRVGGFFRVFWPKKGVLRVLCRSKNHKLAGFLTITNLNYSELIDSILQIYLK